ncbi:MULTISPECIES: hypothetical protein [unclassified Nocardia]|uniref:hypothetical protein n=1 Tax=unclassified Nocardia TaxID=2637762 RepID=UPI001CE40E13|nr:MULTISPECIES: hypothetical protein [unclassified Nocardia]
MEPETELMGTAEVAWRTVVGDRILAIEEQRRRLAEMREQLEHLLMCPSPHPAGRAGGRRPADGG